jgi:hypothetical protein
MSDDNQFIRRGFFESGFYLKFTTQKEALTKAIATE